MPHKKEKDTQKTTSRWIRFYDFYGKHLILISLVLIGVSSLAVFFSFLFGIYVTLPLLGSVPTLFFVVMAATVPHALVLRRMARKEIRQHEILDLEKYLSYILLLSFGVVLVIFSAIRLLNYFLPNLQIEGALAMFIVGVFFYFYSLTISSLLVQIGHVFIPSYIKTKLCLGAVLDNFHQLNSLKPLERRKHVKKYFRWFEDGLDYYNTHIMKTLPNHPKVKEIGTYYDSAYLVALTGTKTELENLVKHIRKSYVSLGKGRKEVDFRGFLISLQHIKGKTAKKDESVHELSKLFETVPFTTRILTRAKRIAQISVTIILLVPTILEIMKYFG